MIDYETNKQTPSKVVNLKVVYEYVTQTSILDLSFALQGDV